MKILLTLVFIIDQFIRMDSENFNSRETKIGFSSFVVDADVKNMKDSVSFPNSYSAFPEIYLKLKVVSVSP